MLKKIIFLGSFLLPLYGFTFPQVPDFTLLQKRCIFEKDPVKKSTYCSQLNRAAADKHILLNPETSIG